MNNLLKLAYRSNHFLRDIITHRHDFEWESQGFGMLRTYLTRDVRLHVWDSSLKTSNVTVIHTHPWDFTSLVLRGSIHNITYHEDQDTIPLWNRSRLLCGGNAKLKDEVTTCGLRLLSSTEYRVGQSYSQTSEEIHESVPQHGSVTIIERHPKADPDHAVVYWGVGSEWVDAKPMVADADTVDSVLLPIENEIRGLNMAYR